MSWKRREIQNRDVRRNQANRALEKSERDYQDVQQLRSVVTTQVESHLKLQRENHFSERLFGMYGVSPR